MADKVRVLRLVEYVGERSSVEKQLKTSLHGSRNGVPGCVITAVTIGESPVTWFTQEEVDAVGENAERNTIAGILAILRTTGHPDVAAELAARLIKEGG